MEFRADERAQAIQIGAVLLFAVLVIAFSLYQAYVVPNQNEQIEMDHSVEVQQQLQDLRNAIVSMPGRTSGTGTTISLGTSYPARIIALNPTPPSGRLSTDGTTDPRVNLTITNATAVGETGDVWNGSTRAYNTGGIVYEPNYNRYRDPPTTVYENSLLYNSFGERNLTLAGQSLLSGNRISLITLNGSLSRSSSASTTVDTQPISSSDRTVLVESNASSPITLNLTTRLSASRWTTLLDDEANVDAVTPAPNADAVPDPFTRVQITLDPGQYRLQMTKVGVGTGATEESAEYLTDVQGDNETITRAESQDIVLEVRDALNNPVSGVTVNGSVDGSNNGTLNGSPTVSDASGQVNFVYDTYTSNESGTHQLQFSLEALDNSFDGKSSADVLLNVTLETERNATNGTGGSPFDITWSNDATNSSAITCYANNTCIANGDRVNVTAVTDPVEQGAPVVFSTNDTSTATDGPNSDTRTDAAGQAVLDLDGRAGNGGWVTAYVSSIGSGDLVRVYFNRPPTASYTYSTTGKNLSVNASDSTDPDGTITEYEWDWDGDGTFEATGETATHEYQNAGQKNVTLRVTDNSGRTNATSKSIGVTGGGQFDPGQAFEDKNGNGIYEPSNGDFTVDLAARSYEYNATSNGTSASFVIPSSVTVDGQSMDIAGENVTIRTDVQMGGDISLTATQDDLQMTGQSLIGGQGLTISAASGTVDLTGTTVDNTNGSSGMSISGTTIDLSDADVATVQQATIDGTTLSLDGTAINNTLGSSGIDLLGDSSITLNDAQITSAGTVAVSENSGDVSVVGSSIQTQSGSRSVTIAAQGVTTVRDTILTGGDNSGGRVTVSGNTATLRNVSATAYESISATATNGELDAVESTFSTTAGIDQRSISLQSDGNMNLNATEIDTAGGSAFADLTAIKMDLMVQDAVISDEDNTLEFDPNNSNVVGTPESGEVSKN